VYKYALVFNKGRSDRRIGEKFLTLQEALDAFSIHFEQECLQGESLSIVDTEGKVHKKHYKDWVG